MEAYVNAALDNEHLVRVAQFKRHEGRFGKNDPFEGFDPHLVGNHHKLATSAEEPADIDLLRTIH